MIKATLIETMGTDLSVANAARVSFGKHKEELDDSDSKLIRYLAKHGHISPFGHCFATIHVSCPIFVARQLVKHKFLRLNEVSRRYVSSNVSFYSPDVWRAKAADKKQGSGEDLPFDVDIHNSLVQHHMSSVNLYNYLLKRGVCEEQARMVLPINLMTEFQWSGSMDAFADMCNLRLKEDTQYETQLIATQIDGSLSDVWPISWGALVSS